MGLLRQCGSLSPFSGGGASFSLPLPIEVLAAQEKKVGRKVVLLLPIWGLRTVEINLSSRDRAKFPETLFCKSKGSHPGLG